jgi:hypothetical protein
MSNEQQRRLPAAAGKALISRVKYMMTEVRAPTIAAGASLSIGRWFKRTGDPVTLDEPLVEINAEGDT